MFFFFFFQYLCDAARRAHTCALFFILILSSFGYRLKVLASMAWNACWSSYRLYSNRRSQCLQRIAHFEDTHNGKAATTAIYTFRHNTHKLVPNMMWWAENAIIMKFTRGKTHNVTIHIKTVLWWKMKRRIKKAHRTKHNQRMNRTNEPNTQPEQIHIVHNIIRFSFVVLSLPLSLIQHAVCDVCDM